MSIRKIAAVILACLTAAGTSLIHANAVDAPVLTDCSSGDTRLLTVRRQIVKGWETLSPAVFFRPFTLPDGGRIKPRRRGLPPGKSRFLLGRQRIYLHLCHAKRDPLRHGIPPVRRRRKQRALPNNVGRARYSDPAMGNRLGRAFVRRGQALAGRKTRVGDS